MRGKNLLVIGITVLIAVGLLLFGRINRPKVQENQIIIQVNGAEYARIPLSEAPKTVTVLQEDGSENVIQITEEGAYMASSTCENQLCVNMGAVTLDNWEFRPNQEYIICLPNNVTVQLVTAGE